LKVGSILPEANSMIAGSCATERYQPRQVRKEAAAVTSSVCRRGAWLSPILMNESCPILS